MEAAIEITGLKKVFKDFWHRNKVRAVQDLNLQVYRGEVFGLLGPNGSGKSTIIKLILGLLFPDAGKIRVFGLSPRNVSLKARLGFLPEESYFHRYLNANETMDFYGRLFGLSASERGKRAEKLLRIVGLTASSNRPVGEYSKGMMRRIGVAQALINDPELVILDEPTDGLDPLGRREVKDIILELKKLGKTVLLSSHLLADVEDVCDRIGILYAGTLIAEGNVKDLLARKNITQISVSEMSQGTIEKIIDAIRGGEGKVDVARATGRLEEFFLETIGGVESVAARKRGVEKGTELRKEDISIIESLIPPVRGPREKK